MPEPHLTLWEVQPRDPEFGIRVVVRAFDEVNPKRTHGLLVYLFNSEEKARAFMVDRPKTWTLESRVWARSIFHRCVKSQTAVLPHAFDF